MHEERKFVTTQPENSETPLESARSWVTPNRLFFVRNHFGVPELPRESWRLVVGGHVARPFSLSWDDLAARPQRTVFATMECAGNGRSFLTPHAHGVQWGAGAVGHAEWTGVPLRLLLEEAGLDAGAREVLFTGADRGSEADHPEEMAFARSLPSCKALDDDTLIAIRMNGELLEPAHGAPARLLVPGWYGVASVKWLVRVDACVDSFAGYYQSAKYTIEQETSGRRERVIVGPMFVKSEIVRPQAGETLGLGQNRIFGLAWAGADTLAGVEVSTDGGLQWQPAELVGPRARYSWVMWEYAWEVAQPGLYTLLARAHTTAGRQQPSSHPSQHGSYVIHHSRPTEVVVEGARRAVGLLRGDPETLLYDMAWFAAENHRRPLDVELELTGGAGI